MKGGSRIVFWAIAAIFFAIAVMVVHQSPAPTPIRMTILVATALFGAMTAFAGLNLWLAFTKGQIMTRSGSVSRDDNPIIFWLSTGFWALVGLFFLILFLAVLDPRDFHPVLVVLDCNLKPWWSCLPQAFHS